MKKYPDAPLTVYAIWTDRLILDARSQWDGGGLTDRRVVHLWDGKDVSGAWFVNHLPGYQGSDWDAYALFGPDATWSDATPPRLLASGSAIIDSVDSLKQAVAPLLNGSP